MHGHKDSSLWMKIGAKYFTSLLQTAIAIIKRKLLLLSFSLWSLLSTQSLTHLALTLASHEFRPKKFSWCEPPADSSSLAHTEQEAHTNLRELETSPGSPTLQQIFAVNLAHVFLSLITASSYMGKTRVTQTVNIHGWKNATPAGCSHFELEIKSARTNWLYPHSVYSVVWNRDTQLFFLIFPAFCSCAEVMALTMYALKLTHIALAQVFMTTIEKPQKKKSRDKLLLSFIKKKAHMPTTIHASSSKRQWREISCELYICTVHANGEI